MTCFETGNIGEDIVTTDEEKVVPTDRYPYQNLLKEKIWNSKNNYYTILNIIFGIECGYNIWRDAGINLCLADHVKFNCQQGLETEIWGYGDYN